MAIELPGSFKTLNAVPLEYWYGPWSDLASAKSNVPQAIRYLGLRVFVLSSNNTYLWRSGVTDDDLVLDTLNLDVIDPISVPSGSDKPLTIDMTLPQYANISTNCVIQVEQLNDIFADATQSYPVYDVQVKKVYTDNTRSALASLVILGHDNGIDLTHTVDELQIIIK